MLGWDSKPSGPAGVMMQLELAAQELGFDDMCFMSYDREKKWVYYRNLLRLILRKKENVFNVHTGSYFLCMIVFILSLFDFRNEYFLTVHGLYRGELLYKERPRKIYLLAENIIYKHFSKIICVSEFAKKEIQRLYSREKNLYIIHNGYIFPKVDAKTPKSRMAELRLIMLGGIRKIKGISETIVLVDKLNKDLPFKVMLDIYGSCENNLYENLKDRLNGENIKYYGTLNNKDQLYQKILEADIHIALSEYDTFNVSILEALCIGCPTITTDMCGASIYISDRMNGLVITKVQDDYMKIKKYLLRYYNDFEYRKKNIQNAIDSVKDSSMLDMAKRYHKLLGRRDDEII